MTTSFESITKKEIHTLLLKSWMTHDAMWLMHTINELGIERANQLNRAAVTDMAAVEAKRILKLIRMESVSDFNELRFFVETATELVIPDFMEFTTEWSPADESVTFEITKCFAFDGVTMLGVADGYECGIYERVYGWLKALGLTYDTDPGGRECLMHTTGGCRRKIKISFPVS